MRGEVFTSNIVVSIGCMLIAVFFTLMGDYKMMAMASAVGALAALAEAVGEARR